MRDCVNRDGQQFGNYQLGECLGGGGFACIYKGRHIYLERHAALKLLMKAQMMQEEQEAFLTEARIIARLEHPHIVPVLEFGIEGEIPFLVMPYFPNGSLRKYHPRGSRLPLPTIASYIKQIAAALQYAHDQKIVHRDIKPDNFLVGNHGEILLSDFGIAVTAHRTQSWEAQKLVGTWSYAAPEHFRGKAVPSSDQYSLAVVIYEWVCGSLPFTADAPTPDERFLQLAYQHNHVQPPSLRERAFLSPGLEEVVFKALAKTPEGRYPSVTDFAIAVEQACQKPPFLIYGGHYSGHYWTATWSHDGKYIASAGYDNTVQAWDVTSGTTLSTRPVICVDCINRLQWSDDNRHLIAHEQVWDAMTGKSIHTGRISISPNGAYLLEQREWRYEEYYQVVNIKTGDPIFTVQSNAFWRDAWWSPERLCAKVLSIRSERGLTGYALFLLSALVKRPQTTFHTASY